MFALCAREGLLPLRALSPNFPMLLCMLCMLQGHSRHNIIVTEGVHLLKTHQGPSVKYLKELNARGTDCKRPTGVLPYRLKRAFEEISML
jgi:hypothetical protein